MNGPLNKNDNTWPADSIQKALAQYASNLSYKSLPKEVIHTAKLRIIDSLGGLVAGFFGEPCQLLRNVAAAVPVSDGATIIGTRLKTTADLAAFVNGTTARFPETSDLYHVFGSYEGHPSDTFAPVFAVAEYVHAGGEEFITSLVLAYEIYQRFCDVFHHKDFDNTNFACIATAAAAGKLLGLTESQIAHGIAMAVVPNNILRQVRLGHLSMYKGAAGGHAGRAGVFAAMLAKAGITGPDLPFEGKAGWCAQIARERFSFGELGGNGVLFKILQTRIKIRPACATTFSSILATEKIANRSPIKEIKNVKVETYKKAKLEVGSGEHNWNPTSRETADHSIPYVVAATLMDGTITIASFNEPHLRNNELRQLMQKIEVVENPEFTKVFEQPNQKHRTRVTLTTANGETIVGEAGDDAEDLSADKGDEQVLAKFRSLTEDYFGSQRTSSMVAGLLRLEDLKDVASMPNDLVLA